MRRLAVLGALALAACGSSPPDSAPSETGQVAGGAAAATAQSQVPDYPGSTQVEIANFGVAGKDSRSGNNIAMETEATPTQVAEFYRKWFADNGIPIRADTLTETGGLLTGARDGEKGAMLTVSTIGGKTRIAIVRARDGL